MTVPVSAILGVLLAGGRSLRMGAADKCLAELGGRPLLAHAVERLRPQAGRLILNANGDPGRFADFGLPVVPDTVEGFAGPLAGILAGMLWARDHAPDARFVATVATDTPFFPRDLVARLLAAINGEAEIAIARCGGQDFPVFGLFPVGLADDLARFLQRSRKHAVMAWIDTRRWRAAEFAVPERWAADPFLNINVPEDLAAAEQAIATAKLHRP